MANDLTIYHGSQQIVEVPQFGVGKPYNDYGQGFYCTESSELAKEWACPVKNDGYCNCYELHLDDLQMMRLTHGEFNILSWLAILLTHRRFDISSPVAQGARDYILSHFLPDTSGVDVMIGYRADDQRLSGRRFLLLLCRGLCEQHHFASGPEHVHAAWDIGRADRIALQAVLWTHRVHRL